MSAVVETFSIEAEKLTARANRSVGFIEYACLHGKDLVAPA